MADKPVVGGVYTILGVIKIFDSFLGEALTGLQFVEITNSSAWDGAYASSRFRPIVERKTDISIFTAMLNPSKRRIEA
jgi:hypothetical protein